MIEINSVREAYEASYKAEGLARLVEGGMGHWTYQTAEQRAVGSVMDVLLEYILALGEWLDKETLKPLREKRVAAEKTAANKTVRRHKKAVKR